MSGIFRPVDGQGRWCLTTPWFDEPTRDRCADRIRHGAGDPHLALEILSVQDWEMAAVLAERFQSGRTFLVGDAAHRMTPFGAFGMNTAIQDAHNLAWKLAAVLQGWGGPGLLSSYGVERRPVAERNVEFSYAPEMMAGDLTRASHTLGYVLGFGYAEGAVVPEPGPVPVSDPATDFVPSARPGRRAPHCWVQVDGQQVSTIDLFDRACVLLTPTPAWRQAAHRVAAELGIPLCCYVVEDRSWARLCDLAPEGAALVRPDGHVGWRTRSGVDCAVSRLRDAIRHILALDSRPPGSSA